MLFPGVLLLLIGSFIFTLSAFFFASRLVKDSFRDENNPRPGPASAIDLFLMLTSLVILLVIWVDALRDYFWLMIVLSALLTWLGWKNLQAGE